jgi:homoserine kinase type II
MAVKTLFSQSDFEGFLSQYGLGTFYHAEHIPQGTVQTNYFLHTSGGKFVFRCYENRAFESVLFESYLLAYLKKHAYPCPRPIKNVRGMYVGVYLNKPFMLFEFIPGQTIEQPDATHRQQLIQKAAELQNLTRKYRPRYKEYRWNYDVELCRSLARVEAEKIGTQDAFGKLAWVEQQLSNLQLPHSMPKGICHCDFHFSNVLFQGDRFAALLDFDDANYTYLVFDLVSLIEWPFPSEALDMNETRGIVQEYVKHRRLNALEKWHLFDVLQLSILIDCIWFFGRGEVEDFYEKRKINFLSELGKEKFFEALFLDQDN